jgi:hypothetical protein
LDAAAFYRRVLTLSLELASRRLPVPPFRSPFPPLWSVAHLFGAVPCLGGRGSAPDLFLSVMSCAVWCGSHEFFLGGIAYIALPCQT